MDRIEKKHNATKLILATETGTPRQAEKRKVIVVSSCALTIMVVAPSPYYNGCCPALPGIAASLCCINDGMALGAYFRERQCGATLGDPAASRGPVPVGLVRGDPKGGPSAL